MAGGVTMQQNTSSTAVSAVVTSGINGSNQHSQNGCNTSGTNGTGSQSSTPTQSITPPGNNAPKYGTLVPNRVFVGGISANTTEIELAQLFSAYGTVKATKIISDRAGVSKGYGFVTFETEDEAKRLQREADNIVLRERKLNIAPAIKKQPFSRPLDGTTPGSPPGSIPGLPTIPGTGLNGPAAAGFSFYPAAASNAAAAAAAAALSSPYFQNGGVTYYNPALTTSGAPADPTNAAAGVYPAPGGLYPTAATAHPHQPPPVSQAQAGSSMSASAAANMSAAVQQNIAAAQCAAAAAAGYPVLYPPAAAMYLPTCAAAGPQQYGYPPNHIPAYVPSAFGLEPFSPERVSVRNCTTPAALMRTVSSLRGISTIQTTRTSSLPATKNVDEPIAIDVHNYSECWYPSLESWMWTGTGFWYRPYILPQFSVIPVWDEFSNNLLTLEREIDTEANFSGSTDVNFEAIISEKPYGMSGVFPSDNVSDLVISVTESYVDANSTYNLENESTWTNRTPNEMFVNIDPFSLDHLVFRQNDNISQSRSLSNTISNLEIKGLSNNNDNYSTSFSDHFKHQVNFCNFPHRKNQHKRCLNKKKKNNNDRHNSLQTTQHGTDIKSIGIQNTNSSR